jgi:hypothetical protein
MVCLKVLENASSSSMHIGQDKKELSSIQNEKVKFVSMGKPDGPVSEIGVSGFDRTKVNLAEDDDFSTSSSNIDDDTDNEDDDQVLLEEFQKLISKHRNL